MQHSVKNRQQQGKMMMQKELALPRRLINKLLHLAQASQDHEICGLISKSSTSEYGYYPINNVAENPDKRFLMAPDEQLAAMTDIRKQGKELFAIYHSHPSAPAFPSAMDIEQSNYPDLNYFIISLNTLGVLEMRSFKLLHDENIVEIPLIMEEGEQTPLL